MKIYHFTTFTNFCSIWIQQKLKFSEWTNCNDVFEREKIYNLSQQSKEYNGKKFPDGVLSSFLQNVYKEVELFRQISFSLDYKEINGYASPMMWGHYARDFQRSGVCLELDSSRLIIPRDKTIYKKKVSYRKDLTPTHICGVDAEKEDAAQTFVIENRDNLFFKKHWHWKYENEYRIVSKECKELDISEAITAVYVLGEDNITLQSVKRIITDSERISYLNVGGLKTLKLNSLNLYEIEELKEEMDYINSHGGI